MPVYAIVIIVAVAVAIVAAAAIVAYKNSAGQKEKSARKQTGDAFKDCGGYVFRDIPINIDGDETSVDLVYVGAAGLYVARVCTQEGEIYGDLMSKEWSSYVRGKETKFPSPIKDRDRQVNALRTIMPEDHRIFSCVVFMNADLKNVRCANVMTLAGLRDDIKSRPKALSQNKIDDIKRVLDEYKKKSK